MCSESIGGSTDCRNSMMWTEARFLRARHTHGVQQRARSSLRHADLGWDLIEVPEIYVVGISWPLFGVLGSRSMFSRRLWRCFLGFLGVLVR